MTTAPETARSRIAPSVVLGGLGAAALAAIGLIAGRVDVAVLGLPLALWTVLVLSRPRTVSAPVVEMRIADRQPEGWLVDEVDVTASTEQVELVLMQSERRMRTLFVAPGRTVTTSSRALHSGPILSVRAQARSVDADAAVLGSPASPRRLVRAVAPMMRTLPALPMPSRLIGLHGAHEGARPGQGGDFRDIHPFAPGDELRRVDWKATARAARQPGDLLVRRTNTLSDASVVLAMDTADDLGAVVASWGTGDATRSGMTSLDIAREAARSLAAAAVGRGDRVSFHSLVHGGRTVRGGSGARHLVRLETAIAATGAGGDDARHRRAPAVPHGALVCVLSTFFDGAAADLAITWRAAGHRVLAVDTLPDLETDRLSRERELALQILLAEREDMIRMLTTAGVEIVTWRTDPDLAVDVLARARRSGR